MRRFATSAVSLVEREDGSADARVTIRFPQVDAAQIIFYPRIFELLLRYFPDNPLTSCPFAFRLNFLRPNRLGDKIRIVFDRDETLAKWSFRGRMRGADHFVIRSLDAGDSSLSPRAHHANGATFKTNEEPVGEWVSDRKATMQLSRYFEYLNEAVEQWFEDTLTMGFQDLHVGRGIGIPTVRFTTRCRELPRVGDVVGFWLCPRRLGNRSMTITIRLVRDDECLIETEQVVVFVRTLQNDLESVPIPDDIRSAFTALLGN